MNIVFLTEMKLGAIGQGGFMFLETTALAMFARCFASYLHCVTNILSPIQSSDRHIEKAEQDVDMSALNDHSVNEHAQKIPYTSRQAKQQMMEAFTIDVSQFSLVLMIEDESGICSPTLLICYSCCNKFLKGYVIFAGAVQEFIVEVDVCLKFEFANMRKKFTFDLPRLSVFSLVLRDSIKNQIQIPHFSSVSLENTSSCPMPGDSAEGFQLGNGLHPVNEASSSKDPGPQKEFSLKSCASDGYHLSHHNCILKQLGAFMAMEKPENSHLLSYQVWIGSGSVSGFDVTISLAEIQVRYWINTLSSAIIPCFWLSIFTACVMESYLLFLV